jgi:hypothetical protein
MPGVKLTPAAPKSPGRTVKFGTDGAVGIVAVSDFGAKNGIAVLITFDTSSTDARMSASRLAESIFPCHVAVGAGKAS